MPRYLIEVKTIEIYEEWVDAENENDAYEKASSAELDNRVDACSDYQIIRVEETLEPAT